MKAKIATNSSKKKKYCLNTGSSPYASVSFKSLVKSRSLVKALWEQSFLALSYRISEGVHQIFFPQAFILLTAIRRGWGMLSGRQTRNPWDDIELVCQSLIKDNLVVSQYICLVLSHPVSSLMTELASLCSRGNSIFLPPISISECHLFLFFNVSEQGMFDLTFCLRCRTI